MSGAYSMFEGQSGNWLWQVIEGGQQGEEPQGFPRPVSRVVPGTAGHQELLTNADP